jgi:hypothetical protein
MAGQSNVSNTFDSFDFEGFTYSIHTNENTGGLGVPPNPGDHQHVTAQLTVTTASGETALHQSYFDNGGAAASNGGTIPAGPGLAYNDLIHLFPVEGQPNDIIHFNAAADTAGTHDAGLQPDLHAAILQAGALHPV